MADGAVKSQLSSNRCWRQCSMPRRLLASVAPSRLLAPVGTGTQPCSWSVQTQVWHGPCRAAGAWSQQRAGAAGMPPQAGAVSSPLASSPQPAPAGPSPSDLGITSCRGDAPLLLACSQAAAGQPAWAAWHPAFPAHHAPSHHALPCHPVLALQAAPSAGRATKRPLAASAGMMPW